MWGMAKKVWDSIDSFLHLTDSLAALLETLKTTLLTAAVLVLTIVLGYVIFTRDQPKNSVGPSGDGIDVVSLDPWLIKTIPYGNAEFKVMTLSKDYAWKFRGDSEVEYHNAPSDIRPHLRSLGMQANLGSAQALIAVGAASQEGTDQAAEESRAQRRAEQLQLWLKENIPGTQSLYTLSLGQFVENANRLASTKDTAPQRIVVVVGVFDPKGELEGNAKLGAGLRAALEMALPAELAKDEAFPFNLEEYSTFQLESWR